jgi:hypothetical protein
MTEKFEMPELVDIGSSWKIGTKLLVDEVKWEIIGCNQMICENENMQWWTLCDEKGNSKYLMDAWGQLSWIYDEESKWSPADFASIEADSKLEYAGLNFLVWQIDRIEQLIVKGETGLPLTSNERPFLIFLACNDQPFSIVWIRSSTSLVYFRQENIKTPIIVDKPITGRVGF